MIVLMPDDHTENVENLRLIKKVERLCKEQLTWSEQLSLSVEETMFGSRTYLEDNSFLRSHQLVNVYGKPEKRYEVRSEGNAVDVQIHEKRQKSVSGDKIRHLRAFIKKHLVEALYNEPCKWQYPPMKNKNKGEPCHERKSKRTGRGVVVRMRKSGGCSGTLKHLFKGTLEQMLEAETDEHLGYEKKVSSETTAKTAGTDMAERR